MPRLGPSGGGGFVLEFLKLLNIQNFEIIEKPTQFQSVLIPEECCQTWWKYTQEYNFIYETLIFNAQKECAHLPVFPKIYLTHQQWQFGTKCVNEQHFEAFFKALGFEIIAPETLSLKEQIYYLSHAKEVVCTMGTLSHLGLFCQPNTLFAVLTRKPDAVLAVQALIFQARKLNAHIIDATENFLPDHFTHGIAHLVMNDNFKNFIHHVYGNKASELIVQFAPPSCDYVKTWAKYYSTPHFYKEIAHYCAFDLIAKMAYETNGIVLDKNLYAPTFLRRSLRTLRFAVRFVFAKTVPRCVKNWLKKHLLKSKKLSQMLGI